MSVDVLYGLVQVDKKKVLVFSEAGRRVRGKMFCECAVPLLSQQILRKKLNAFPPSASSYTKSN